jgi:hypothetical protein
MGVAQVPAASGSAVKSVQRGSAGGAGSVTITAVDINKSFVTVFGSASSGTVSASFGLNSSNVVIPGVSTTRYGNYNSRYIPNVASAGTSSFMGNWSSPNSITWVATQTVNAANTNAGSNNLVAATVQGYLSNSTTLVVSGACRWEVVEFN